MTQLPDHTPDEARASSRRAFLAALSTVAMVTVVAPIMQRLAAQSAQQPPTKPTTAKPTVAAAAITIYKDPNCGCCVKWIEHMKKAGFVTTVHDTKDMASIKSSMGVPTQLQSCHTAVVGSYVIEGHVPADLVMRALREKPAGIGLAVPGMPAGSPGMEGMGVDHYDIVLFDRAGKSRVFASR